MSPTITIDGLVKFEDETLPKWFTIAQFVLRILSVACTLTSIIVMATSNTSVLLDGVFRMDARFYYSSAFKVLMGVNGAVCGTVLLTIGATFYFVYKTPNNRNHWYLLFLHDLIMMVLMISACGASTAIGYVGMHGQPRTMWLKVCDNVEKFCVKVGTSVVLSYVAFLCLMTLTIISSYALVKPFTSRKSPSDTSLYSPPRSPTRRV